MIENGGSVPDTAGFAGWSSGGALMNGSSWNAGFAPPYQDGSVDSSSWPVQAVQEPGTGIIKPEDSFKRIRRSRRISFAVWCALWLPTSALTLLAFWLVWSEQATQGYGFAECLANTWPFLVPCVLFLVITVPLIPWARYSPLTSDELHRINQLQSGIQPIGYVKAVDLCRAYGLAEIMAEPDHYHEAGSQPSITRGRHIDAFMYPYTDGMSRFHVAARQSLRGSIMETGNPNADPGIRCIVEMRGLRARIVAEDGAEGESHRRSGRSGITICAGIGSVKHPGVSVAISKGQWEEKNSEAGKEWSYDPLRTYAGIRDLVLAALVAPLGFLLASGCFKDARSAVRRVDRFAGAWIGAWTLLISYAVCAGISYFIMEGIIGNPLVDLIPAAAFLAFIVWWMCRLNLDDFPYPIVPMDGSSKRGSLMKGLSKDSSNPFIG